LLRSPEGHLVDLEEVPAMINQQNPDEITTPLLKRVKRVKGETNACHHKKNLVATASSGINIKT
jgi:hypothetical protein